MFARRQAFGDALRRRALRCAVSLPVLCLPIALAFVGCSNGNPDSNEHGYVFEAGTDTTAAQDSTALGDVVVVQDGGPDTGEADSAIPIDSAPLESGSALDSASVADVTVD